MFSEEFPLGLALKTWCLVGRCLYARISEIFDLEYTDFEARPNPNHALTLTPTTLCEAHVLEPVSNASEQVVPTFP